MCSTQDGFELAEADMRMRGPGDIEGTQQSGLPIDLKLADLAKDSQILEEARRTALSLLDSDPFIERPANQMLRVKLSKLRGAQEGFSRISQKF